MRRMTLFAVLAALAVSVGGAGARSAGDIPKVGWVSAATEAGDRLIGPFKAGLGALGWIDGRTVRIEPRWAAGAPDRVPALVRELAGLGVAVIVAPGTAVGGARRVAGDTPVVFGVSADPVLAGLVQSLARPGGRFTGVTFLSYEVNEKRLELLREAFPKIERVALLSNPDHAGEHLELAASREAAAHLGLELHSIHLRTAADVAPALDTVGRAGAQALVLIPDAFVSQHGARIIRFAAGLGLPVLGGWSNYARWGAVMTYGPNLAASFGRLAHYVDRILKGAKPADPPVERPTTFELVVNRRAAEKLGIALPRSILLRADRVIE